MTTERMVLRAELFHESRHIVCHTTEVTPSSVCVRTDEALDVGATVRLRLSFPRLFAPVQVMAHVVSHAGGSGHGYLPGFVLDFAGEHERIAHLFRIHAALGEDAAPYRILVIEDSAVMRDVVHHTAQRFLNAFRVETHTTDQAAHALELIAYHNYDLALVDLYLPGALDGAHFVRELRARGNDLPVIGFSVGGPKARAAFLDAGADLFLDKPIMLRDVFGTLERLVVAARREL
jgi:CheY-like chemotaxis protein